MSAPGRWALCRRRGSWFPERPHVQPSQPCEGSGQPCGGLGHGGGRGPRPVLAAALGQRHPRRAAIWPMCPPARGSAPWDGWRRACSPLDSAPHPARTRASQALRPGDRGSAHGGGDGRLVRLPPRPGRLSAAGRTPDRRLSGGGPRLLPRLRGALRDDGQGVDPRLGLRLLHGHQPPPTSHRRLGAPSRTRAAVAEAGRTRSPGSSWP